MEYSGDYKDWPDEWAGLWQGCWALGMAWSRLAKGYYVYRVAINLRKSGSFLPGFSPSSKQGGLVFPAHHEAWRWWA
ncbi:hypothetical protein MishRS11D_28010 [Methylomagnum ishizawai]|nr:hypothetical protein MishRS11D_28010 [Methylomagnum ishizawai]